MQGRPLLAAVAAAGVLVAAGCGGPDGGGSGRATPANEWANGLCSSLETWKSSLSSIAGGLRSGGLTTASLQGAADRARTSTDAFATGLVTLGMPESAAEQKALQSLERLRAEIPSDIRTIEAAVNGASGIDGVLNAVGVTTHTITEAGTQLTDTVTGFRQADVKGELEAAFKQAPNCRTLTGGA